MDKERVDYFRQKLLNELRRHTEKVRENQAAALEMVAVDDGVKDTVDMSLHDVNQEIALRLGERESQNVADVDQALMRMDEGSYGICARCEKPIDERRLEVLPTARYDAQCQAIIEASQDTDEHATL